MSKAIVINPAKKKWCLMVIIEVPVTKKIEPPFETKYFYYDTKRQLLDDLCSFGYGTRNNVLYMAMFKRVCIVPNIPYGLRQWYRADNMPVW